MNKLTKEQARIVYKNKRLNALQKEEKQSIIFEKISSLIKEKHFNKIAIYYSFKDEINTVQLIDFLKAKSYKIYLPKIVEKGKIEFYLFEENTRLEKNSFGIFEPFGVIEKVKPEDIDLIIVPGLAYNNKKKRLGYGGGYYDRYLPLCANALKVGLFYKEQFDKDDSIIFDEKDFPLDLIITN